MQLEVSSQVFERFPQLRIGVVTGKNVVFRPDMATELESLKLECSSKLASLFTDKAAIRNEPRIDAWREIYRSLGVNPKKYTPTAEAFILRLFSGKPFPNINPIVDAYLCSQIKGMLPIGGYDIKNIEGNITLRFSLGGESFVPVGSSSEEETIEQEIVYTDERRILTRFWNFRDCDFTKIDVDTGNFMLMIEAPVDTITAEILDYALNDLYQTMLLFFNGAINYKLFSFENCLEFTI